MVDCLDRCGSVVLQSVAVLSGSGADAADSAVVLSALEALRGLSEDRLDAVCTEEAAAYEAVLSRLRVMDGCVGAEVVSSCMALCTLGCRNGASLCGRVDVIDTIAGAVTRWLEYAGSGGDDYEAGAALGALLVLAVLEAGPKMSPESRGPAETGFRAVLKDNMATVGNVFTEQRASDVVASSMKAGAMIHDDLSMAVSYTHLTLPTKA